MLLIQSSRLKLRTLNESDNINIFSYASNSEVSKFLNWDIHADLNDTNNYLSRIILLAKKFPMNNLGIEVNFNNKNFFC
jgi:ribosomal-protein-alanine N-acetyltransferase